jgi:hypothetical protein
VNYLLEAEPLDLGPDVRAVSLELVEGNEDREPVLGKDAAAIWSRVLSASAGTEPWALDFFSHLDRLRDYCDRHGIAFRIASKRSLVIDASALEKDSSKLAALLERFEGETFGARAGGPLASGDPSLEAELAHRGVDAYHSAYPNYLFCAACNFEDGSLVLFSNQLWATEVVRRIRPLLADLKVDVRVPA